MGKRKPKLCGAQSKRTGKPCKARAMANGRCYHHGGKSTGPPKGSRNALKHGIYSRALRPREKEQWEAIDIEGVDDEIRIVKLQLARTLEEIRKWQTRPEDEKGLGIVEVRDETNDEAHTTKIKRRPDLHLVRDRLILRLAQLMRTKALLRSLGMGNTKSADEFAQDIRESITKMEDLSGGSL